jgi:hypothetical protein
MPFSNDQKIKFLKQDRDGQFRHYDFVYQIGINIDVNPIQEKECSKGGLYFTTVANCLCWAHLGNFVAIIELCEDSVVVDESCGTKSKTNKFNITNIITFEEFTNNIENKDYAEIIMILYEYHYGQYRNHIFKDLSSFPLSATQSGHIVRFFATLNNQKTESMCVDTTDFYPKLIKYVPPKFYSKCSPCTYEYIPNEHKTQDFWRNVMVKHGYMLEQVKEEYIDMDICIKAVLSPSGDTAIQYVPNKYKTSEFWKIVIEKKPYMLKYIVEEQITYELCLVAVLSGRGFGIIDSIPEKYKTEDLIGRYQEKYKFMLEFLKQTEIYSNDNTDKMSDSSSKAIAEFGKRKFFIQTMLTA